MLDRLLDTRSLPPTAETLCTDVFGIAVHGIDNKVQIAWVLQIDARQFLGHGGGVWFNAYVTKKCKIT